MGCCQSTSSTDETGSPSARSPHIAAAATNIPHDSSRAAIIQPSQSLSNVDSPRTSVVSHPPPPAPKPVAAVRPNLPIRPPSPVDCCPPHLSNVPPPWSWSQLQREREAFFDTRVTGRAEVWNALKLVCELLQKGDLVEAQGILDAVGITCPNGRVTSGRGRDRVDGGVYDERGVLYELPAWVVSDPEDVIDDREEAEKGSEDGAVGVDGSGENRREEKGKGRAADLGEIVVLRARLSDRGADVSVQVGMEEKVSAVVRKIQERIGPRGVRLAYLGHVLLESKTLEEQGYQPRNVVNAFVFDGDEELLRK